MLNPNAIATKQTQLQVMMNYAAELELEVDRLRRRDQFLQEAMRDHIRQTIGLCGTNSENADPDSALRGVREACESYDKLLRDMYEPPGYHPAFDQVIAIALRPLAEKVFRWQQRLSGAANAVLRLDLQPDSINWFPARLRHILDNLISNALRFRDPDKGEIRVGLQMRLIDGGYELQFSDNGLGIPDDKAAGMLELFYRAAPTRTAGLGVGLAVVKLLVEHSCGTLSVSSREGFGTCVTVVLPRFDIDDHID